jgi:general stress protein 26
MSFTSGRCLFVVSDRMEAANGRALMPEIEPTVELHEGFSEPDATARPWAEVVEVLSRSEMFWLSTVRREGRPHVTPLPAIWLDGTLHFCAGAAEQKAKNLESNPRCILTTGTNQLRSGLDVVVEGAAVRVTDNAQLQRLAAIWKSKLDWDFEVGDGAFRDPDGRQGLVFGVTPTKILSFGKAPYSQTRYTFKT